MSNNSSQKNQIYRRQTINSLPYGDIAAVRYIDGSTLAAARLNNTFQQLVDNDKVIEHELVHISSYNVGPKAYDETAIYAGENGYKTWKNDDDNQLSILRKVDLPLQDSIVRVEDISCEARCICRAAEKIFVGTADGLYASDDGKDFQLSSPDGFYAAYSDSYNTFFVGSAGVYQLNAENYSVDTQYGTVVRTRYFLSRRNKNDVGTCTAVWVRNDSRTIYVGTEDGVYSGALTKNTQDADIALERMDIFNDGVQVFPRVNSIQRISQNDEVADETLDLVAATSNGLYQSHEMNGVTERSVVLNGADVKAALQFMGKTYAVANNGLYDVAEDKQVVFLSGAKCCAKTSSAVFVGGEGAVARYLPYASEGGVTKIALPGELSSSLVEQIFLVKPVNSQTGNTLEVLVGRTSTGSMFTVDVAALDVQAGYEVPGESLCAMYANESNKLYAANSQFSDTLSVFDVKNFYTETADTFGVLSLYDPVEPGVLAYAQPAGQSRPVDKMVCATSAVVSDRQYGYSMTGKGITLFKPMTAPDEAITYGVIDSGTFKPLTEELAKAGGTLQAQDFSDTSSLIVLRNGSKLQYIQKNDSYEEASEFSAKFESAPASMQSDGINVYFLVGGKLSAVSENPLLRQSGALSDRAVYNVKSATEFDMVIAATQNGIEFHKIADAEGESITDTLSVFPGTVRRCDFSNGIAYAYTNSGVSAYQLSTLADGAVRVSKITDDYPIYQGQDVYDRKTIDIGTGYEFVATSLGLSVGHYEFAEDLSFPHASYGTQIYEGYPLVEQLYAIKTNNCFLFRDGNNEPGDLLFSSIDSNLVMQVDSSSGDVSAYARMTQSGVDGIWCVKAVSSENGYAYSDSVKVGGFAASFISQQMEFSSYEYQQRGILVADLKNIYAFGNYSSPVAQFDEIRALDNYYSSGQSQSRIFVSDGGTLRECSVASGAPQYLTYSNLTGVEKIVVDQYGVMKDGSYESHADLLVLKEGSLYRFDLETLDDSSEYGDPALTGVTDLRENVTKPYKAEIYASSGKCAYAIDEYGEIQKIYESSVELVMFQQSQAYATKDSAYLYGKRYAQVDARKCVQLSCCSQSGSGYCRSLFGDGKMYLTKIDADAQVDDIEIGAEEASGVKSFASSGEKVAVVGLDNTYCPDICSPAVKYDFSAYGISLNGFIESTAPARMLFEFSTNSLMFATSAGVYGTDTGKAELALAKYIEFGSAQNRFSLLKRTGGSVYAVQDADVFLVKDKNVSMAVRFSHAVDDVIKSGDAFYARSGDDWRRISSSGEILEANLKGREILDIPIGADSAGKTFGGTSDSIFVVAEDGLYESEKVKAAKLAVMNIAGGTKKQFNGAVQSVVGSASGSSDSVNVIYSSDGYLKYCQYSYQNGTVKEDIVKVLLSNGQTQSADASEQPYSSRFFGVYPVDGDIDTGKTFVTLGSSSDLYQADGEYLTRYPDIRVTSRSDLGVNSVAYIGDKYYICTTAGVFVSKQRGKQRYFEYVADAEYNFTGSAEFSKSRYLFASQSGLFTMVNKGRPLSRSVYKNEARNEESLFVKKYNTGTVYDTYAYASGCSVLTSDNAKKFDTFLILPQPECGAAGERQSLSVWDMYAQSKNDYYFATSDGLYRTQYSYVLSNDVQKFTALDAKNAYDGMQDQLSAEYVEYLSTHIKQHHVDATDVIPYVNEHLLSVSFDGIQTTGWSVKQQNEALTQMYVYNDMAYEILYGDQNSGEIYVNASNFLISADNVSCSYIFKRYMSGLSELYVYIPTTYTYYINHVKGAPGCSLYGKEIKRPNLKGFSQDTIKSDVTQQYSTFEMGIDATFLSIDTLLGVQVNGNSLPLKVYRDTSNAGKESDACLMYHSFIEPSKMLTPVTGISVDSDGEYKLKFACFGSDAQAVKITLYDALNGASFNTYSVVYHANGAQGSMASQRFAVGASKKLRKCQFTWPSSNLKTFNGWTTDPDPEDNTTAMYSDQQLFKMGEGEIENGGQVHLYAVWLTYQFSENDMTLLLDSTNEEFFIDSAGIMLDTKYGNKVIIDYGD